MSRATEVFQLKRIISFFGSANTLNQIDVVFNQVRLKERGRELLVNAKTNNVMDVIFCLTIKKTFSQTVQHYQSLTGFLCFLSGLSMIIASPCQLFTNSLILILADEDAKL